MANTVSVKWNETLWSTRLGSAATIASFKASLIALNARPISVEQEILISLSNAPGEVSTLDFKIEPPTVIGWDFNEVLSSDWGKEFLEIFQRHNINFFNTN